MAIVKIKGMNCQHCVGAVTKALSDIPGISDVKVDLEKGKARFVGNIRIEVIKTELAKIGFEVV